MTFQEWKELILLVSPLVIQIIHAWRGESRYRRRVGIENKGEGE